MQIIIKNHIRKQQAKAIQNGYVLGFQNLMHVMGLASISLLILSSATFAATPEAPSISRDVHLSEGGVTTRPYIPAHRTTADGRVGITRRSTEQNSTGVGFFLFVPEKYNNKLGTDYQDNPNGLDGKNGLSILSTRAGDIGDEQSGINPELAEFGATTHSALPSNWVNLGHQTLCDASDARTIAEQPNQQANPYQCGDKDCYDIKIISHARNSTTGTRHLTSSPVTITVANPKTKNAYIESVELSRDVNGEPSIEYSRAFSGLELRFLLEPQFTADGKLLVTRTANSGINWLKEGGVNPGRKSSRVDIVYIRNSNGPEAGLACDIKLFDTIYPFSYAPSDPKINQRYGFAKYPFRDPMGNPISDESDLQSYPWIDKKGNNIVFGTSRPNLYRNVSGTLVPDFPARCLPGFANCEDNNNIVSGGAPTGHTIMGLWTHGKAVYIDGLTNNIDYMLGRLDEHQRELQLYQPSENADGWLRIGNGTSNKIRSFSPRTGYPINTGFFETNESAFHYLRGMEPPGPFDVSWLVSTGAVTEELPFDDYLNRLGLIVSNMSSASQHRGNIGHGWTNFTGNTIVAPRLQNAATALPEDLKLPSYGKMFNTRIERVASGGIVGRGLWLEGEGSYIEYAIPTEQPKNLNEMTWNIGLFVDSRFDPNANNVAPRQLIRFPDGTSVWMLGRTGLQFRDGNNVLHEIKLRSQNQNAKGWLPQAFNHKAWNHIGFQVSNQNHTVTTFYDGMQIDTFQLLSQASPGLFSLSATDNGRGGGSLIVGQGFRGWIDEFKIFAGSMNLEGSCNLALGTLKGMYPNHNAVGEELQQLNTSWIKSGRYPQSSNDRIGECVATTGRPSAHFERYACDINYNTGQVKDRYPRKTDSAGMTSLRSMVNFPEGPYITDQSRPDSLQNRFCQSCHADNQKEGLVLAALTSGFKHERPPSFPDRFVYGSPLLGALEERGELGNVFDYIDSEGRFLTQYLMSPDVERFTPDSNQDVCYLDNSSDNFDNVAKGKSATQSSNGWGGIASRAIDGNINGSYSARSVTHTQNDQNAWWQVDLGESYDLTEIKIWNRTDCCTSRLSNFRIFISDEPFSSTNIHATRIQAGVTELDHSETVDRIDIRKLKQSGRYVRIQQIGTEYLSLAEVEVFGHPQAASKINVARNGDASQSSTGWGGHAARVIDGNTNGNYEARSVSHTTLNSNAWWEIDLGAIHDLSDVAIWNRTHDITDRLSDFYILVSDTPFTNQGLNPTIQQQGVSSYFHSGSPKTAKTTMPINRTGRYLRVQLAGRNYLSLAEVEIFER